MFSTHNASFVLNITNNNISDIFLILLTFRSQHVMMMYNYIIFRTYLFLCNVMTSWTFYVNTTEKAQNASELLDTLLEGYDRRLRPGFGGEILDKWLHT